MERIDTARLLVNATDWRATTNAGGDARAAGESFRSVLDRQLQNDDSVRFSAHAQQRLAERGLALDTVDLARVNRAVDCAAAKGARNSLLVGDRYALVVSVANRVVVTAMNREAMTDQVVTNIDSTVFV